MIDAVESEGVLQNQRMTRNTALQLSPCLPGFQSPPFTAISVHVAKGSRGEAQTLRELVINSDWPG